MPPKKRNEIRFSVSVTAEQKSALEEMADRERVSLAPRRAGSCRVP